MIRTVVTPIGGFAPGTEADHGDFPRENAGSDRRVVPLRRNGVPPQPAANDSARAAAAPKPPSLGKILVDSGEVKPGDLLKAIVIQKREQAPLAEILIANDWLTDEGLRRAMSRHWRTSHVDLVASPPDPRMIDAVGVPLCLAHGVVPWRRIGGIPFVATCRPEGFEVARALLPASFANARMVLTDEEGLQAAILATRRTRLIREAELCTPAALSCRTRDERRAGEIAVLIIAAIAVGLAAAPLFVLGGLSLLALLLLLASSVMKAIAFAARVRADATIMSERCSFASLRSSPSQMREPLPVISVMVPMFREEDIAARLVGRLSGLTYPRELTDIVLVVEECDTLTRDALAAAALPRWMRVVVVPDGPLRTKPRALNYAQNFCRGSIIGVWDAEDWPEPEQLHKVARQFAAAPPEVVCLQGVLDFYNPRTNWMARCFSIEYASWFRAVLPGMARLGLIVPLGGTTLFFRREPLAEVGGWDAWNVTEDADLGLRLMRHGYRTEMVDTVTHEEANCRPRAWVKQRSRWHKGYFMTWLVHMRQPRALWRDIGPRAFLSFQLQLAGTVVGFLIAPLLWSYWLLCLGLGHPMAGVLSGFAGGWGMAMFVTALIAAEVVNMVIGLWAVRSPAMRHLAVWLPATWLYFPLGCLAAWKAIYEVVVHPFYWDKTLHGLHDSQVALPDPMPGEANMIEVSPARLPAQVPSVGRWEAGAEPRQQIEVVGAIG